MKKLIMILSALLIFSATLFPQMSIVVSIENQQAVGNDFFFDLYLRTSQASDSLFLGNSDFVLTFDASNFNLPALSLEGDPFLGAFCTFVPRLAGGTSGTRENYSNAISVNILNVNRLVINLAGQNPSSQSFFNNRVARIDNTTLTHRLGRFRVSGITNPTGFMNLQWETASLIVSTYQTVSPFTETQVLINAIDPGNAPLPVELVSFTANYKNSEVMLSWKTETEVNNYGFNVERRIGEGNWDSIAFIEGHGNSNSPKEYSYGDKDLFAGGSKFQYRLKQVDTDGTFSYSDVVEVEVVPDHYELSQNYPNPFNPSTTIKFAVPEKSNVLIKVYDILGSEVAILVNEEMDAGWYENDFNAVGLSSGVYLFRMEAGKFISTKKMILLR